MSPFDLVSLDPPRFYNCHCDSRTDDERSCAVALGGGVVERPFVTDSERDHSTTFSF